MSEDVAVCSTGLDGFENVETAEETFLRLVELFVFFAVEEPNELPTVSLDVFREVVLEAVGFAGFLLFSEVAADVDSTEKSEKTLERLLESVRAASSSTSGRTCSCSSPLSEESESSLEGHHESST